MTERSVMRNEDYFADMEQSLKMLRNATQQDWEWLHTGGGCSAFILTNYGGSYCMITDEGAGAPMAHEWSDGIVLCEYGYDEDGEHLDGIQVETVTNLKTLREWATAQRVTP